MILTLEKVFLGLSLVISLKETRVQFHSMEVLIFAIALIAISQSSSASALINLPILFSSFYSFLYPFTPLGVLENCAACNLNLADEAWRIQQLFLEDTRTIRDISVVMLLLLVTLARSVLFLGKNMRRKIFHFASFFIFIRESKVIIKAGQYLIFVAMMICKTGIIQKHFTLFLNTTDRKKDSFSHVFLLCAMVYPYFFLNGQNYLRLLISICIMDSFASIAGNMMGQNRRTLVGFVAGQLSSYLAEFCFCHSVDVKYHLTMGVVEFFCPINDNIAIAFFSCIYQIR